MNSFSIQSFGCRVNQAEAFSWTDEFQKRGLFYVTDHRESDLILINTCTVTSRADRDARSFIRRMNRENPAVPMVVTGCFAERAADKLRQMPGVWLVLSNPEKKTILERVLVHGKRPNMESRRSYRSRALVKIQDGCDLCCTFCVVPSVRGGQVSTAKNMILNDVRRKLGSGFKEVVLVGVHLTLYGRDLNPRLSLLDLLQEICALPGLHRLRLSSLDPRFMDPGLQNFLVSEPRICPHFHLSLQHGSDPVIARMGRKITVAEYEAILNRLVADRPRAALGTDIIVGFPGETEADFETMYEFLKHSPINYFHVFPYSPRSGTPAASWKQVRSADKKNRATRLRALAQDKNLRFRQSFIGKKCEAVVVSRSPDGSARVLTDNYIEVDLTACTPQETQLVSIKITQATARRTHGRETGAEHEAEE
jgi:threonylcarbamoyladenosine tRNA methylthiotransferase MtaB